MNGRPSNKIRQIQDASSATLRYLDDMIYEMNQRAELDRIQNKEALASELKEYLK